MKKIYRTTYQIEVLSDEPIENDVTPFRDVVDQIDEGDWMGSTKIIKRETLVDAEAIQAIEDIGGEPAFFFHEDDEETEY